MGIFTDEYLRCDFSRYFDFGFTRKNLITKKGVFMFHPIVSPVIALIAGILILIFPELLNIVVAIYLIAIGIMGLIGHL
jgi:hypothetical protein